MRFNSCSPGAPPMSSVSRRGGWVALSVARALHFLHAHDVAHLGVAPDCVLLADDGTAVLGDLGAARLLGPHTRAVDPARTCHSRLYKNHKVLNTLRDGTALLGDLGASRLLGPHTCAADPARPCCFLPLPKP